LKKKLGKKLTELKKSPSNLPQSSQRKDWADCVTVIQVEYSKPTVQNNNIIKPSRRAVKASYREE